jgi:hypothetical protein
LLCLKEEGAVISSRVKGIPSLLGKLNRYLATIAQKNGWFSKIELKAHIL